MRKRRQGAGDDCFRKVHPAAHSRVTARSRRAQLDARKSTDRHPAAGSQAALLTIEKASAVRAPLLLARSRTAIGSGAHEDPGVLMAMTDISAVSLGACAT